MPTLKRKIKTVAVIDDHSLFREAVSNLINKMNGPQDKHFYKILIEAENGQDFIEQVASRPEKIDIVILDIHMPKMDGLETLRWINLHCTDTKVLMLSMNNSPEIVSSFMKEGAAGYLTKEASKEKIFEAIRSIITKGIYYDDFITSSLIETLKKINYTPQSYQSKETREHKALTDKEKEILTLFATELTYREIAEKMRLSLRTIDGYREELFRKFSVNTRVGLVLSGIKYGIIDTISNEQ